MTVNVGSDCDINDSSTDNFEDHDCENEKDDDEDDDDDDDDKNNGGS